MKTTVLAPTGDAFKVLYQDDKTLKGPILGVSGTLTVAWGMKTDDEKLVAVTEVVSRVLKTRNLNSLHEQEIVFTTNDTEMDYNLALPAMVKRVLSSK